MVSGSHVLVATIDWRWDVQCIGAPWRVWADPDMDFLVFVSLAKSESEYEISVSVDGVQGICIPV